jgi:hypothetical protein
MLFKIAGWTLFFLSSLNVVINIFITDKNKIENGIGCLISIAYAAFFWYVLMVR